MPTQRHEEKRVEECGSVQGVEGGGRERESALVPPFICFFLPLGLPYANWA